MSRRLSHVLLTLVKELRESLRDRRTLAVMILFPLVVYPLLSLLAAQVAVSRDRAREARPSLVAVAGTGSARDDSGGPDSRATQAAHPGRAGQPVRCRGRPAGRLGPSRRGQRQPRGDRVRRWPRGVPRGSRAARRRHRLGLARGLRPPILAGQAQPGPRGQRGWLPAVQSAAAAGRPDGAAGRLLPGHRRHRWRARTGHARNHSFVAHPAFRPPAGKGSGGDRSGRTDRTAQSRLNVRHLDPGDASGGSGRNAARALDSRRRCRRGGASFGILLRIGLRSGGRSRARIQRGAAPSDSRCIFFPSRQRLRAPLASIGWPVLPPGSPA